MESPEVSHKHGLISPPTTETSPAKDGRNTQDSSYTTRRSVSSAPIDAEALSTALEDYEDIRMRRREHTPGESPVRKKPRKIYGDRCVPPSIPFIVVHKWEYAAFCRLMANTIFSFIPNREGQDLQSGFRLLHDEASPATPAKVRKRTPHNDLSFQQSMLHNPRVE